jgi:hypothetical protein
MTRRRYIWSAPSTSRVQSRGRVKDWGATVSAVRLSVAPPPIVLLPMERSLPTARGAILSAGGTGASPSR